MADVFKANAGTDLSLGASWQGGVRPGAGDIAVFDSTGNSGTFTLGGSYSFGGIRIDNPAGAITINSSGGQTLTLGSSGINMAAAAQNLTLSLGGTIALTTANTPLDIGSAITCTLSILVTGAGFGFIKSGAGIAVLTGNNTGMTGQFALSDGTVRVGNAGALGGAAASLDLGTGTITSNSTTNYTLTNAGASLISGNVTFGAAATFTGGLTFNNAFNLGASTRTLTCLSTTTLNGVISGDTGVGLTKAGGVTLFLLNVANTFSGPLAISQGTVTVLALANGGSPSSIGASSNDAANLTFANNTTLSFPSSGVSGTTDRNFTLQGPAQISATGTTIPVLWSGSPTLTASSTLTLAGSSGAGVINTFSGTLANTGAFVLSLTRNSSNTWKLTGTNTFTGVYTQSSTGITQIGNDAALGSATATMSLSGGTLSSDGGTARTITNAGSSTIGGNITFGSATNNGALTFTNAISLGAALRTLTIASPVTFTGVISNGGMVKAGSSTLTLSGVGTNTYSTASTLSAGTLVLGKNSALGSAAWTISAGTTLDASTAVSITNSLTINSFTFTGTANLTQSTGAITLNTSTITVTANTLQLGGAITGAAASLTKEGAGQLTLAGANESWGTTSGNITVNAGTLRGTGTTTALGANTAGRTFTVASNATLSLGAAYNLGNIPLFLAGAGAGGVNDMALLITGGVSPTFSSITLTAPATIRASASATLTASITLNGNAPTFLASSGVTFTLPSVISDTGTATVTIGHAANTYTGTVSLTNAANTFSGQVRVLSGTLSASVLANAGTNSSIGTGATASTIQLGSGTNSATFTYNSSTTPVSTDRAIELMGTTGGGRVNGGTSAGILTLTSNPIVTGVGNKTFTLGNNGVFSGVIADGGGSVISLTSAASSAWTLSNTNTYTGTTTVAGTLSIASASNIGTGAIAGGVTGTLNYTGISGTVSNALNLSSSLRIALPTASSDVTFSGLITGINSLTLGNTSTTVGSSSILRLTNTGNTWTGGLTINNGAVYVTNIGQLGTGTKTIQVAASGTGAAGLALDGTSGNLTLPSTFSFQTSSGTGVSEPTYYGVVNVAGDNKIQGNIAMAGGGGDSYFTVSGGTLELAGTISSLVLSPTRRLQLRGTTSGTVSGVINNTNTPGVTLAGSAVWTLSNTNLYAGGTLLSASGSATAFVTNTQGLGVGNVTIQSATAKVQSATASGQNGKLTVTGTLTNSAGGIIRIGG